MRVAAILTLIFCLLGVGLIIQSCGKDEEDEEDELDCHSPLTAWFEDCDFSISFNDQDLASYEEAYDSCQHGYGKMWNIFIHCYLTVYLPEGKDCQAWAECAPDHGFITDDDIADDDAADDDATDDDLGDDDATDDDLMDDDTADDDATDDDITDDDTADDDTVDDDTTC